MVHIVIPGKGEEEGEGVSQQKEELAEREGIGGGGERLSAGVTDGRREGERAKDEANLGKLLLREVNAFQSSQSALLTAWVGGAGWGARGAHGLVVRRDSAAMSIT